MKRAHKLYILLGILAVLCVAVFAVSKIETHKENIKNSDEIIMETDPSTVTALSWKNEDAELSFINDNGVWKWEEDEVFQVDEDKINELLEVFRQFGVSFEIDDVTDVSPYGLDTPVGTVNFTADGKDCTVLIGDFSTMDSKRYVSIGDGKVYLVSDDPMDEFSAVLSDLLLDDKTPCLTRADALTFSGAENYSLYYSEDNTSPLSENDRYYLTEGDLPLDTDRVESYAEAIGNLDLSDYVTYKATEDEISKYGMDAPELTVTLDYLCTDDNGEDAYDVFTLSISRDPQELSQEEESDDEDEDDGDITAYARVGDSAIIYKITGREYKTLMAAGYNDLRHREVVPQDLDELYRIDAEIDGKSYSIVLGKYKQADEEAAEAEEDAEETPAPVSYEKDKWYFGDEETDVEKLKAKIENLAEDSFTDEAPTGKEELSLTLYFDNADCPEVNVKLYRRDGKLCLAEVNGESFALITRSSAVELIEGINSIVL